MASIRTVGFVTDHPHAPPLAQKLALSHFHVRVFEVLNPFNGVWEHPNMVVCSSIAEAVEGCDILFLLISDLSKLVALFEDVLSEIVDQTAIILCGLLSPSLMSGVTKAVSAKQEKVLLMNAIISVDSNSGVKMLVSGSRKALESTGTVFSVINKDFVRIEGDIDASSKVWMVEKLMIAVHLAAAAEAMVLGAAAGINTRDLYEIITNAAGSSCAFVERVPQMLEDEHQKSDSTVYGVANCLDYLLEIARSLLFPLSLTAVANQYFRLACSCGYGDYADSAVVKVWEKTARVKVTASRSNHETFARKAANLANVAVPVRKVGFIGLGAMGFGMAATLLQEKFIVCGFDVYEPTLARFRELGGLTERSAAEAARGAEVVVIMVATEAQAEMALFGVQGAIAAVPKGCTIILCSTVSPSYVTELEQRLRAEDRDLQLVDAPVSGGVKKAANGTLTIMAAGSQEALKRAGTILSTMSETLYIIDGGAGKGSGVKVVNQLLAGVHIAISAEAMAFGARLGLDTKVLYHIISNRESGSWMFTNRVPHMLNADYTPYSAVNIFVKDLGIVLGQGKSCGTFLHLAATAHQQFLLAAAAGFTYEDDSAVVKIFEKLAGISVAASNVQQPKLHSVSNPLETLKVEVASKTSLFENLVPEWPENPAKEIVELGSSGHAKVLVVLDDDPTGTQTVHGVTVLTEWSIDSIREEFQKRRNCFFILTNSRALSSHKAFMLIQTIATNVKAAAAYTDSSYTIVLRGDSTLRGHFPEEADAITSILGDMDAWRLVPAGETEFAKDAVFGYHSSNLKD